MSLERATGIEPVTGKLEKLLLLPLSYARV